MSAAAAAPTHTHTAAEEAAEGVPPPGAEATVGPADADGAAVDIPSFPARLVLPDGLGEMRLSAVPLLDVHVNVRSYISDHPQTCMLTSYRLELEAPGLAAPMPISELTDLTPLASTLTVPLDSAAVAVIRVRPEPFDVRRARHHVRVFREVLTRPPITSVLLAEMDVREALAAGDAQEEGEDGAVVSASAAPANVPAREAPGMMAEAAQDGQASPEATLTRMLDDACTGMSLVVAVQGQRAAMSEAQRKLASISIPVFPDLGNFFPLPLRMLQEVVEDKEMEQAGALNAAENPADNAALLMGSHSTVLEAMQPLPQCMRSLTYSGWNPPPAHRRMMGDFFYLRLETFEGRVLHVTATALGFYVNRTSDEGGFDPTPADPAYASRTLWSLLNRASPNFRTQYRALVTRSINEALQVLKSGITQWDAAFNVWLHEDFARAGLPGVTADSAGALGAVGGVTMRQGELYGYWGTSVPAATYGMAVPPAGPFAFYKVPWLVPAPTNANGAPLAAPDTAASGAVGTAATTGAKKRKGGHGSGDGPASTAAVSGPASLVPGHTFDLARAEDDLLCTFGMHERGSLRDWNEEWQACKELPSGNLQERLVRARATAKVLSDFVDAATQGCIAIVQGHITCLDPAEDDRTHVYVYNNIFFSLALDSRTKEAERRVRMVRERTAGTPSTLRGAGAFDDLASLASPMHDMQGVVALNRCDVKGLHTLATTIVTYAGHRFVAQSVIPGILQAEASSRMVYGSVDNGATIAAEPAVHELLRTAAPELCIAERVITPAGTTATAQPASRPLLAQRSSAGEQPVSFIGPVECKGIQGSDGRYYLLDCVRFTPRDPVFYDRALEQWRKRAEHEDPAARHPADADEFTAVYESAHTALLRPELLQLYQAYRRVSAAKRAEEAHGDATEAAAAMGPLRLNVNVFTRFAKLLPAEERAADEAAVREVSAYLLEKVVPHMFHEWRVGNGVPLDGESLTRLMHSKGINMRYLGTLASLAATTEAQLLCPPYLLELFETEMVSRVAARQLNALLRDHAACKAAPAVAVAVFLSALLGVPLTEAQLREEAAAAAAAATAPLSATQKRKQKKAAKAASAGDATTVADAAAEPAVADAYIIPVGIAAADVRFPGADVPSVADLCRKACVEASINQQQLWTSIAEEVRAHFDYDLRVWASGGFNDATPAVRADEGSGDSAAPASALSGPVLNPRAARLPVLRRVCQRCGVQLFARAFDWTQTAPIKADDVAGLAPVVKTCMPASLLPDAALLQQEARALIDTQPSRAFEKVHEATMLLHNVLGMASKELAYSCQLAAVLMNFVGDNMAAMQQQQRAVLMYERVTGPDSPETAQAHNLLGSYLAATWSPNAAVRHMHRCLYLLSIMAPAAHPEIASVYARLAVVYQTFFHFPMTIRCLFEALRNRYDAASQMSYAHALALAFASLGNFRDALRWERKVQQYYKDKLGEASEPYSDSTFFVNAFTKKAVEFERAIKSFSDSPAALDAAFATDDSGAPSGGEASSSAPSTSKSAKKGKKRK